MFIIVKKLILDSVEQRKTFTSLLRAFEEKNHLIWINTEELSSVLSDSSLIGKIGEDNIFSIEKLLEVGNEFEQMLEEVNCYLEIDFTNSAETLVANRIGEITHYKLSYMRVNSSKILNETLLLAEHLDDCNIYYQLGLIILERKSIQTQLSLQYDSVLGGGSSTFACLESELTKRSESLILCVVDSDRNYPAEELTNDKTAKKALDIYNERRDHYVIYVHDIDAKYIENLMPKYISEQVFLKQELGIAHDPQNEQYRLFLDKKKCITLKCLRDELANLDPTEGRGKFISDLLVSYIDESDSKLVTLKIHGNNRLSHYLDKIQDDEIRPLLINDDASMWNKVAKHVFSWCLSHNLC